MAPLTAASSPSTGTSPLRSRGNLRGKYFPCAISNLEHLGLMGGIFTLFFVTMTMMSHSPPCSYLDHHQNLLNSPDKAFTTIPSPGKAMLRVAQGKADYALMTSSIGGDSNVEQSSHPKTKKKSEENTAEIESLEARIKSLEALIRQQGASARGNAPPLVQQAMQRVAQEKEDTLIASTSGDNSFGGRNSHQKKKESKESATEIKPLEAHMDQDAPSRPLPLSEPTLRGSEEIPITSTSHVHQFRESLDKDYGLRGQSVLCLPWDVNSDEWWTHHPGWEMGPENATHYCFAKIQDPDKTKLYKDIYNVQFHGDCSQTYNKRMWNSGWSADLTNILDGLQYAVKRNIPVQVAEKPWHYADPASVKPAPGNRNVPPTCSRRNMFCYFLPISACPAAAEGERGQFLEDKRRGKKGKIEHQWYYEYVTRRQTWLRKSVYDFLQKQKLQQPCTGTSVIPSTTSQQRQSRHGLSINLVHHRLHVSMAHTYPIVACCCRPFSHSLTQ
jgi:hypothetical protein